MGNIFDRTVTVDDELDPWKPTVDPLKQNIALVGNQSPWTSYQGDWVANMNNMQLNGLQDFANYGNWQAQWFGNRMQDTGRNWMDRGTDANRFYQQALGWNPITNQGPDMQMVAMMADNPYMSGMIDAASRDVTRNLYENQMPGIAASSAGAGQAGSSRRGAAEAIASRGAADRIGDIASNLRGAAYGQALGIGADIASENAQLKYKNRGQMMDAADAMRSMALSGVDMIGKGGEMRRQGYQDAIYSGDRLQKQAQEEIDALMAQHDLDQRLPYDQAKAGIDAIIEPAYRFGNRDTDTTDKWDGAADMLTALLTGGGTKIDFGDMLSGNFGGAGGAGGSGGNADSRAGANAGGGDQSWLEILLGGLAGIFNGGGSDSSSDADNGQDGTAGDQGTGDVNVPGGTSTSPNNEEGDVDQTIEDSGVLDQDVTTGGTSGDSGDKSREQKILDLVAAGMTIEEATRQVDGQSGSGDVDVDGGTSTAPDNTGGVTSGDVNDAVDNDTDLTDEEKAAIKAAQEEEESGKDDANEEDDVTGILIGTQGGGGEPNSNTGSDVNVGNPGGPASSGGTGSPGGNGGDGATYNTPWGTQRSPSQNELPGGNEAADFTHELHRNTEGINDAGDQVLSPDDYDFIQDSYQSHYQNQLADGKTPDQAKASAQYHSLMMAEALGAEVDWDKYPDAKALKEQNEKEQKERLGPGGGEGGGGGRDGDGGRSSNPGHTGPGTDLKPEITISEV